jgi:hypothetical protein
MKKIILRPATPDDLPIIRRLHAEQNERDGTSYPLPLFFTGRDPSQRVPVSLVGVEEDTGNIVQAIWIERRAELMFAGCDNPKATAFARRDIDAMAAVLGWLGYTGLHCDAPLAVAEAVWKPLEKAGFEQNDERLAHFYKDLREKRP